MNSPRVYLFLDFDGVLHAESRKTEKFAHVKAFEGVVRRYVNDGMLAIVISSTWRKDSPLTRLRSRFSADVAKGIVGVTPVHEEPGMLISRTPEEIQAAIDDPRDPRQGIRQRECESWMATNAPEAPWFAVDDCALGFDIGCDELVLVNPESGLCAADLELSDLRIRQKLHPLRGRNPQMDAEMSAIHASPAFAFEHACKAVSDAVAARANR